MVGSERSLPLFVFLASLLLYVGTSGGSLSSTDAVVTFEVTRSIVEHGSVALPGNVLGLAANQGVDGRYYSQYGLGQSLYNVPFYLGAKGLQRATGLSVGKTDSVAKAVVSLGSTVAAAGTVAVVFVLAWLVTGRADASLVAALACGAGSPLWPYARLGFSTALTAWILAGAACALYAGVRHGRTRDVMVAGLLVGAGCLTRHEFVLIALAFTVWLGGVRVHARESAPSVVPFLAGAGAGVAVWALYNLVRFGSPWFVGYVPTYDFSGYYGLLFSPSASVFLYSPAIVLALAGIVVLARQDAVAASVLALPAVVLLLYYGALTDWAGGRSYGPRYLVPAIALTTVAIAPLFARASRSGRHAIVAVVALSAVVQLPGVLVDYSRVSQAWAETARPSDLQNRRYVWSVSPLVLNSRAAAVAVPGTVKHLAGREPLPPMQLTAGADRRDFSQQFAYVVDFWWVHLFYFRVLPSWLAVLTGIGLIGGAIGVAVRAGQWGSRPRSAA